MIDFNAVSNAYPITTPSTPIKNESTSKVVQVFRFVIDRAQDPFIVLSLACSIASIGIVGLPVSGSFFRYTPVTLYNIRQLKLIDLLGISVSNFIPNLCSLYCGYKISNELKGLSCLEKIQKTYKAVCYSFSDQAPSGQIHSNMVQGITKIAAGLLGCMLALPPFLVCPSFIFGLVSTQCAIEEALEAYKNRIPKLQKDKKRYEYLLQTASSLGVPSKADSFELSADQVITNFGKDEQLNKSSEYKDKLEKINLLLAEAMQETSA